MKPCSPYYRNRPPFDFYPYSICRRPATVQVTRRSRPKRLGRTLPDFPIECATQLRKLSRAVPQASYLRGLRASSALLPLYQRTSRKDRAQARVNRLSWRMHPLSCSRIAGSYTSNRLYLQVATGCSSSVVLGSIWKLRHLSALSAEPSRDAIASHATKWMTARRLLVLHICPPTRLSRVPEMCAQTPACPQAS